MLQPMRGREGGSIAMGCTDRQEWLISLPK